MPPKRGDVFIMQKIKGVPDVNGNNKNLHAGSSAITQPAPKCYRFMEPIVHGGSVASSMASNTAASTVLGSAVDRSALITAEPAFTLPTPQDASQRSPPPTAGYMFLPIFLLMVSHTYGLTRELIVSLKDQQILSALEDLRTIDRIGLFNTIEHILSDDTALFEAYRASLYQDSSDALARILDLVVARPDGARKLRAWLDKSEFGKSLVGMAGRRRN
jgi:hypothetical protein